MLEEDCSLNEEECPLEDEYMDPNKLEELLADVVIVILDEIKITLVEVTMLVPLKKVFEEMVEWTGENDKIEVIGLEDVEPIEENTWLVGLFEREEEERFEWKDVEFEKELAELLDCKITVALFDTDSPDVNVTGHCTIMRVVRGL